MLRHQSPSKHLRFYTKRGPLGPFFRHRRNQVSRPEGHS